MDREADGGVGWRRKLTPVLNEMGIVVFDPCDKPLVDYADEGHIRAEATRWLADGDYDRVAEHVRQIRVDDLALVDHSHFIIVRIDVTTHLCGSYEELFWANRLKRPCLCFVEQGKVNTPRWLFGTIPHEHIFDSLDDVVSYLRAVHTDPDFVDGTGRWKFFDFAKVYDPAVLGVHQSPGVT